MSKIHRRLKSKIRPNSSDGLMGPDIKPASKHSAATAYQAMTLLVFVILGFFIYSNTLKAPFFFDDEAHIPENPHIRLTELTFKGITEAALKSPLPHRLIANITFALNYYFHRYNVIGYHLTNIAIHILATIFLCLFVENTLRTPLLHNRYARYKWIPFFAALIWLVHPIQIQAVTYIVQRMTSLAAMFYILSLLFYVKGRLACQSNKKSWTWFVGCVIAGIFALGCKEIAATLPLFILLYELYFFQELKSSRLKHYLPYIISVFIISVFIGLRYLGSTPLESILSEYDRLEFTLTERLLTQPRAVIYYISLLAYPSPGRLNFDHNFTLSHSLIDPLTTLPSIAAICVLIGLAFYMAKRQPLLSFCILWFFGNLVIESSVIGLDMVFEHRLYLPSMFVGLAFVALACRWIKQNWVTIPAFCVIALLCCMWTYQRNSLWNDPVTLWKDSADKSPGKPRPQYNLANAFYDRGNYSQAIKYYTTTLQLDPNRADAHIGLAFVYLAQGKADQAITHCTEALQLNPREAKAYYNLGRAFYRQNKLDKAIEHYNHALRLNPRLFQIYNDLATAFYRQGKIDKAIAYWNKAMRLRPDWSEALNNLAWTLATHQDQQYRNAAEAVRLAKKACELTEYKQPDLLDTLAAAYAAAGKFTEAVKTAEKAIELAMLSGNKPLAEQIQSRLQLYKTKQPYISENYKPEIQNGHSKYKEL